MSFSGRRRRQTPPPDVSALSGGFSGQPPSPQDSQQRQVLEEHLERPAQLSTIADWSPPGTPPHQRPPLDSKVGRVVVASAPIMHRRGSLRDLPPTAAAAPGPARLAPSDLMDTITVSATLAKAGEAPWYIIRPTSSFMGWWDAATSIALILTALVTPFEVSFLEPDGVDGLFVMNRMIDAIFIVDMALQFFLMYQVSDEENDSTGGGRARWEHRLKPIARHYLRGWFAIDVLSIVPSVFDILPLIPGSGLEGGDTDELKVVRVVRTARLIKLIRLARGSRMLKRWRTRMSISFARLSIISLFFELVLSSHWLACLLSLQTSFGQRIDSWFGAFGWCTDDPSAFGYDEKTERACADVSELYLVCLHWAFGIIAGFGSSPEMGPYPPQQRDPEDRGAMRFTVAELFLDIVWVMLSAFGRAYVTARVVAIIAHGNPDWTAFKNRMDRLNLYISFYQLQPEMARRLREYFYETRTLMQAQARRSIVEHMTVGLQEAVCEQVNQKVLSTVPFFRGMTSPDGTQVVRPVESSFIAKVAVALASDVFAPMERPPSGRIYVIMKGRARYKGSSRGQGYCWGALDVMLPNVGNVMPMPQAVALDYLHVQHVDGQTLRRIAEHFPESRHSLRQWTMINGIKEYMLYNLRTASDEERRAARAWLDRPEASASDAAAAAPAEAQTGSFKMRRPMPEDSAWLSAPRPTSIPDLHSAMEKHLDTMNSRFTTMIGDVAGAMNQLEEKMEATNSKTLAVLEQLLARDRSLNAFKAPGPISPPGKAGPASAHMSPRGMSRNVSFKA